VFVRNKKPGSETVQLGEQCEIPLLLTHLSMFDACGILFSEGIKGIAIGG
jgi:hypothetical protein